MAPSKWLDLRSPPPKWLQRIIQNNQIGKFLYWTKDIQEQETMIRVEATLGPQKPGASGTHGEGDVLGLDEEYAHVQSHEEDVHVQPHEEDFHFKP